MTFTATPVPGGLKFDWAGIAPPAGKTTDHYQIQYTPVVFLDPRAQDTTGAVLTDVVTGLPVQEYQCSVAAVAADGTLGTSSTVVKAKPLLGVVTATPIAGGMKLDWVGVAPAWGKTTDHYRIHYAPWLDLHLRTQDTIGIVLTDVVTGLTVQEYQFTITAIAPDGTVCPQSSVARATPLPSIDPTGVDTTTTPATFTPAGSNTPTNLAALQTIGPLGQTTAWPSGQYIALGTGFAHWDGTAWQSAGWGPNKTFFANSCEVAKHWGIAPVSSAGAASGVTPAPSMGTIIGFSNAAPAATAINWPNDIVLGKMTTGSPAAANLNVNISATTKSGKRILVGWLVMETATDPGLVLPTGWTKISDHLEGNLYQAVIAVGNILDNRPVPTGTIATTKPVTNHAEYIVAVPAT